MYRALIPLLFAMALSACKSPIPLQTERLNGKASCCNSFADFKYTDIELAKPAPFRITEEAAVFSFIEGKSYFAAFKLPRTGEPRRLVVRTWTKGLYLPASQTFCPALTYLDSSFQSVRNTGELSLIDRPAGWITDGYWWAWVYVPPEASYAVIHTAESTVGSKLSLTGRTPGYVIPTRRYFMYMPGERVTYEYPCGQTGSLEIEIRR